MGTIPSPRTARGEGGICGSPPPSTHNALFQRNELLFLFLPLFEVYVDERLQLQEIFLHALPVDVLQDGGWGPRQPQAVRGARHPPWRASETRPGGALACKDGLGQSRGQGAAVRDVPQQVALEAHSVHFRGLRKKGEARGASS